VTSSIFNKIMEEISSGWASVTSFIFAKRMEEISSGWSFLFSLEAFSWFIGLSPDTAPTMRG